MTDSLAPSSMIRQLVTTWLLLVVLLSSFSGAAGLAHQFVDHSHTHAGSQAHDHTHSHAPDTPASPTRPVDSQHDCLTCFTLSHLSQSFLDLPAELAISAAAGDLVLPLPDQPSLGVAAGVPHRRGPPTLRV